ncbi:MAG: hypothetical protein LBR08_10490 [Bacteroidales bacterium]|jgi:hypothetical protein|nr:hypothetical protein [Bacteroidales bacterium]
MQQSILKQIDRLTDEIEDLSAVMEKTEVFRSFGKWIQERHIKSNVLCEINRYRDFLSITGDGTVIRADGLLQIRYTDDRKRTEGCTLPVEPERAATGSADHN